ncbi:MAG: HAD-IA family hydrolase [Absicoccus porci]|uniref:HAD family hydrolase n=1 Tax=Absicoccus porci TaxID=2486576 RepID=UPI0023F3BC4F|nr:HAD-IA family hydrolase [Absicoccus porci]MDD7330662.1 HAD-IA family hydrolase [Absicoccus porci]MDD7543336.1 HAD-IA family hydrolase [Peptoniphilaceae bacterium]MDY5765838.1 HAD-IA family hydrolase [Peptoniphilaceae bacterium]
MLNLAKIKAVFFDIDNTLLDFDAYVKCCMLDGFAHFGLPPFEMEMYDTFLSVNDKLWMEIEEGKLSFEDLQAIRWNRIFHELNIDFDGPTFERYFRDYLYNSAIPVDGARTLLRVLQGRALLAVASNGPYEQQMHRLEIADMKLDFDFFCISEDIGAQKPTQAFFDRAFEILNQNQFTPIRPDETLMIGDSVSADIIGGKSYGMQTCLLNRTDMPREYLEQKTQADLVVKSLRELAEIIDNYS